MIQLLISAFVDLVLQAILKAVWGAVKAILARLVALFRRVRAASH